MLKGQTDRQTRSPIDLFLANNLKFNTEQKYMTYGIPALNKEGKKSFIYMQILRLCLNGCFNSNRKGKSYQKLLEYNKF